MMIKLTHLRASIITLFLITLICGGLYSLMVTLIAHVVFPKESEGSLIVDAQHNVLGSELIGQHFTEPRYFWGRLSATSGGAYNGRASSGSNLSSSNKALFQKAKDRINTLQHADPTNHQPVPVDLVTASASGLDPDISVAAAMYQVPRVARARHMTDADVIMFVKRFTKPRQFGILGEPSVNVLKLNLALDHKL